ncbi:MAG: hypothetical protein ACRD68_14565, partial [Pyrinomonadaceae bacterium]
SNITRKTWDEKFDRRLKATFFNLHAKMRRETIKGGATLVSKVERIATELLKPRSPERLYAVVEAGLPDALAKEPLKFRAVDGSMHKFPEGWERLQKNGSFKTRDRAGNLQLTFARGVGGGELLADIDLDDHSGVEHAADVLRHKITSKNTDPFDIHEILVYFQNLDPGYKLV